MSTAEISDKEAAKKVACPLYRKNGSNAFLSLSEGMRRLRQLSCVAKQYPELYAVAKRQGDLPEKEGEELRKIMTAIFEER